MAFDLAELDTLTLAEQGLPMPLINLRTRAQLIDDDGTPVTITLVGRQSEAFRDALKSIQTKRGELRNRGQEADSDAKEREDIDILIACTRDWSFKTLDKAPFPCTPQNIRKLWHDNRFRPLRELAMNFLLLDANFLAQTSNESDVTPAISLSSVARSRTTQAPSQTPSKATA